MKQAKLLTVLGTIVVALIAVGAASNPAQDGKPIVTTYAELPKHVYPITDSIADYFVKGELGDDLAKAVRNDIYSDLENYSIQDTTTMKNLLGGLVDIAMILGEDSSALTYQAELTDLVTKPSARALSGLLTRCAIAATKTTTDGSYVYDDSAFAGGLNSAISNLDWNLVQNDVKQMKGRLDLASEGFLLGLTNSLFGPFVAKNGALSGELVLQLLQLKAFSARILPFKSVIVSTLGGIISANSGGKSDIWTEREVDLTGKKDLSPVIMGIWDTGVDPSVFPNQMDRNEEETPDGKDDDSNGFVDDLYGIAYDYYGNPESDVLLPLADSEKAYVLGFADDLKGGMDLRAGIDSKESGQLKQKIGGMKPQEVGAFMQGFSHYVNYIHGTHIAGIAVAGNPAARIVVSRVTLPYQTPPGLLTIDDAQKYTDAFQNTVKYFESRGVRVVCMSWDMREYFFTRILEVYGIGADQQERERMGKEIFEQLLDGMKQAMASAPEILFVVAAGNFDNDIDFQKMLPASIDLPNVLSVGAVDIAGDETSFTSFGKAVDVFANGSMVESKIPGGKTVALSGTSQAAPKVGNLAAKLLAVAPELSTTDIVNLIMSGAAPQKGGRVLLINPRRSFELLEKGHKQK